jgi:O-antigen ligase
VADGAAILTVASLPWSTSATGFLVVVWALSLLPTLRWSEVARGCATSYGGTPLLLFGLGLASLGWTDASLKVGISALVPFIRLLAIPFLILQFRNSDNGHLVIGAYLAACTLLLMAAFLLRMFPAVDPAQGMRGLGVPVKNRIDQNGEFALCGFGLLLWAGTMWRTQRRRQILVILPLASLFFAAIFYVQIVRTELIVFAVLFALVFSKWLGWKGIPIGLAAAGSIFALAWISSPTLQSRVSHVDWELREYYEHNRATSAGDRLEWWRKSLEFVRGAPLIGHGVGSIRSLFAASAVGQNEVSALVTANPHNQIFAIAIELGLIGVAALFAMWTAHARLFQGVTGLPWLGMIVVAQNVVGSLFNSHLFDFTQSWTYIFGVGVLGGMALSSAKEQPVLSQIPCDGGGRSS